MDKAKKSRKSVASSSKQWTTFLQKKIIPRDATHKEIDRQQKLLADDYDKKLLSCASTNEDLRHIKSSSVITRDEREGRRESNEIQKRLLQPLQKVTSCSSGHYNARTSPGGNIRLCRDRLSRGHMYQQSSWNGAARGLPSTMEWSTRFDQTEQRRRLLENSASNSGNKASLEKCLQVQSMVLPQIKKHHALSVNHSNKE